MSTSSQPAAAPKPPVVDPDLERLKTAISEKNSCSGTRVLDAQNFILYYGEDHSARFVNSSCRADVPF